MTSTTATRNTSPITTKTFAPFTPSKSPILSQQIPSSIIVSGADDEIVNKKEQEDSNLLGIDEDDTRAETDTETSCYTYTIMLMGQCVVMCQQEILRLC